MVEAGLDQPSPEVNGHEVEHRVADVNRLEVRSRSFFELPLRLFFGHLNDDSDDVELLKFRTKVFGHNDVSDVGEVSQESFGRFDLRIFFFFEELGLFGRSKLDFFVSGRVGEESENLESGVFGQILDKF